MERRAGVCQRGRRQQLAEQGADADGQRGPQHLAFRGIGESNGLGYLLDNVVATASGKAEIGQVSAQLAQDDNAARARGDQASADADKQRLEQEKGQQLAAIAGTRAQLEATDQHKLAQNGQDQRAAIEAESREMTAQLDTLARRFEQVRASDAASEPSGQHWRTGFADRLLSTVQKIWTMPATRPARRSKRPVPP